jgi:type I restriction enzyme, R subunit
MADQDRTKRFLDQVLELVKAYALVGSRDVAAVTRNDSRRFAEVRTVILKFQNLDASRGGGQA